MKKLVISIAVIILLVIPTQVSAYQITVLGPHNEVLLYKELTANNDTVYTALTKTRYKV